MNRFQRSWKLARSSAEVLRISPKLVLFPVSALVLNAMVLAIGLGIVTTTGLASDQTSGATMTLPLAVWVVGFLVLIGVMFVSTVCSAALVINATAVLSGREMSVAEAFSSAWSLSHLLLYWALVQATVVQLVRAITQRSGLLGAVLGRGAQAAWSVLTFLVIPVIVFERCGPFAAMKRSGVLLKSTWGENLIGQMGFGLVGMVASIPAAILLFVGIAVMGPATVVGVALCGLGGLGIVGVALFVNALSGIYRAALYQYAVHNEIVPAYSPGDIAQAFSPRA
ncbi:MAG: DUF6159 family protein [Acidimicrobiia bacterium]